MITLTPVHAHVGAEVSGVDLSGPLDDATLSAVQDAIHRHGVLVFREQPLSDAQQITFSRRFGTLELTKPGSLGEGTELVFLSNVADDGTLLKADHRQVLTHKANSLWHSDSSFKSIPALGSALSARTIPPEGAETQFACMRSAWRDLAPELQARVEGRFAWHSFETSRAKVDPGLTSQRERAALPAVRQPIVRTYPPTGEKAVYLGSHASHIDGMDEAEGRALIEELMAFATQERYVYTHVWGPHDLVLWDNRCTIHRARPFDTDRHARVMVRTTIAGEEQVAQT